MKLISFLLALFAFNAFALEVDEKLTARIVKISETRKTVMVNRGIEDGLAEGDHAKFIVTAGIVARAVVVKISPTRSVWSIYRLVNADYIVNDSVMTLKITPPIKLTKDETQSLVQEDVPSRVSMSDPAKLGIPLAEGAFDESVDEKSFNSSDLTALENSSAPSNISDKNFEVYGMLNISGLSASTKTSTSATPMKGGESSQMIGLGFELYSGNERNWYSSFSLAGQFNLMNLENQSYSGVVVKNSVTEFEVGVNWHPTTLPSKIMTFIPFIHGGFSIGAVKSTSTPDPSFPGNSMTASGKTNGFSLGFGYKFYTGKGFGFRALLDYYMRAEKYEPDLGQFIYSKTVAGPRLNLGIGYRF